MNDIMKQIRELKDEIAYLEADKKQLENQVKYLDFDIHIRLKVEEELGLDEWSEGTLNAVTLRKETSLAIKRLGRTINRKKSELTELRTLAYHVEGESQYCLLDLNDIVGVIDKDGFIRGIKF